MKSIVVGYDGSEHARRALGRAADLARNGRQLVVVSVAGVAATTHAPVLGQHAPDPVEDEATRDALRDARALLTERAVEARFAEGFGDPADAIVKEAEAVGADLIVVGARGLNALERALLGSVSTKVVHNAPCDVLVVR